MRLRVSDDFVLGADFVTSTQAILAQKGKGKCLAPETPVLRYDGTVVRADSIRVGDKLMGPNSRPRTVTQCSRGRGHMYEIIPAKGEPWRCNDSHVLTLKHTSTGEIIDIPLNEWFQRTKTFRFLHMLFMTGVNFGKAYKLPIDPYFLGLWFGDGTKTIGKLGLVNIAVTTIDQNIENCCRSVAHEFGLKLKVSVRRGTRVKTLRIVNDLGAGNQLLRLMRSILGNGLQVPHEYLTASRKDRLAFLAGWLDSDGHLSCNCYDFVQKRRDWADAVMFLANSVGMRTTIRSKTVNGAVYWRVRITGETSLIPVRLRHKKAKKRRQRKDHHRVTFKVEPCGIGDYVGFTLDGDGRFLLGDFTVTHNSYTAAVEAEELLDARQQVVVIDPTDAWFGLRSSPDGKSTGYPIVVFGGEHGDVPLEPGGGAVLAEAVVRERFSAIICTETMTKGEELRFLADFLETLYRKNRDAMHLFIDEADIIAPQQPLGIDARTCGATDDLVRRGRKKGIGVTLISQRASVLNKNVLSQADMLVALGCSHPLDLAAIDKWVRSNAEPKRAAEMMASLPSLPRGEAWAWNPSQHLFKRVAIRQRRTFDSGATPKAGQKKREPKVLAPVDLARLGEAMTAAVQRQKDNDPTELKKQVAALRKELDRVGKGQDRAEANEKANHAENIELRIEVAKLKEQVAAQASPAIKAADLSRLEKIVARAEASLGKCNSVVVGHYEAYQAAIDSYTLVSKASASSVILAINDLRSKITSAPRPAIKMDSRPDIVTPGRKSPLSPSYKTNGTNVAVGPTRVDGDLKPAHLRLLSAITWWESVGVSEPDLVGVAFAAGTSAESSAFNNNRSRLRAAGYIDYPSPGRVKITPAGRDVAPVSQLPSTNEAIQGAVMGRVAPAIGRLLRVLIDAYPHEVSLEDFAEKAGTSASSSAFNNNRSWLRARGLSTYPRTGFVRATELLFPEGGA